jgi:hypothetical protein
MSKGSKDRTTDHNAFREGHDNIKWPKKILHHKSTVKVNRDEIQMLDLPKRDLNQKTFEEVSQELMNNMALRGPFLRPIDRKKDDILTPQNEELIKGEKI